MALVPAAVSVRFPDGHYGNTVIVQVGAEQTRISVGTFVVIIRNDSDVEFAVVTGFCYHALVGPSGSILDSTGYFVSEFKYIHWTPEGGWASSHAPDTISVHHADLIHVLTPDEAASQGVDIASVPSHCFDNDSDGD